MRISIVSRIYLPEGSAATPTLAAIADKFASEGHSVTVITVKPPRGQLPSSQQGVRVRRAPVLRDRDGYVRGIIQYLSFDVPLIFRLLFRRRPDLYIVEAPPTTVAVVRLISSLQRRRYFYRLADIWSDAAQMATGSRLVITLLRFIEKRALRGAAHLFAVSAAMLDRARAMGAKSPSTIIGWGIDPQLFRYRKGARDLDSPYLIYGGTHSEWHGAGIFIDAFAIFVKTHPDYRLIFVGNGADRNRLIAQAQDLGLTQVECRRAVPPHEMPPLLQGASFSLASFRPGGYDFAFASKIFASLACGCPTIYSGPGPTIEFLKKASESVRAGEAVEYDVEAVAEAMAHAADSPLSETERKNLADWAGKRFSLESIANAFLTQATTLRDGSVKPD